MFELALCVNDLNADYLERKLPKFRDDVLNLGGMFNIHRNLKNVYFLIASNNEVDKIRALIVDFICDCIRENLKKDFIIKNLNVNCKDDIKKETLIEALVNFDRISDDAFIKRRLRLSNEFHIYSFYMFRLVELKKKWEQLLVVTNQSSAFLKNDEIYLEVIRYLIDGIEMGNNATIEKINNTYITKTDKTNILCKIDTSKNLVNFLIRNNPKKIIVKSIDDETLNFITQIFGKRIEQG